MRKLILIPALLVAGCNTPEARQQRVTDAELMCRDGVEYIYMTNSYGGSMTAHLKPDGKPYTC